MSLTGSLSIALTGLDVARRSLQTTANNIANANTEGYVRKKLSQSPLTVAGEGRGVRADEIERIADSYLTAELRRQNSVLAREQALRDGFDRAQALLFGGPGEQGRGVTSRLAGLATTLETFSTQPEKVGSRVAVLGAIQDLVNEISSSGKQIQKLRLEADQEIARTVDEINDDLQALDSINTDFGRGFATPELLDQRDRILDRLAKKLDISVVTLDRNQIAVYARGGTPLLEYGARRLIYEPATVVAEGSSFNAIEVYSLDQLDSDGNPKSGETGLTLVSGGTSATTSLTGGRLKGLLELRDSELPELAGQFDELAELVRFSLNEAHNAAVAQPPPTKLTGSNDTAKTAFDAATRSGTAYLSVIDRSTGDTLTTVEIDVTDTAATIVSNLNSALSTYGTVTLSGDGPLEIDLGSYGIALNEGTSAITVTDSDGRTRSYGFSHYFGLNDIVVKDGTASSDLAVHSDIADDAQRIASALLDVDTSSSPAVGTLGGVGDNRGVRKLIQAMDRKLTTLDQGALPSRSTSMREYATDILAAHAQETARFGTAVETQDALVQDLTTRKSAVSGVNLDEELSRLVLFQQAYTASARVMTVTSQLFDELMNIAG